MKKISRKNNLIRNIAVFLICLLIGCNSWPEEVQESLKLAGKNRSELEKVLKYYRKDSLGLRSTFFLIGNMKWHSSLVIPLELRYQTHTQQIDSLFSLWIGRVPDAILFSHNMSQWLKKKQIEIKDTLSPVKSIASKVVKKDLEYLNSNFLIAHINNALEQWKTSSFARHLSFEEFCEYLLPYRCIPVEEAIIMNGSELKHIYGKYLEDTHPFHIANYVNRYLKITDIFRQFHDSLPQGVQAGLYEMFYRKKRDCIEDCINEINVLRSCGVPVALDYNIGNREFVGQHHHCVYIDSTGKVQPFNAAMKYPTGSTWGYAADLKLNIYRLTFSAQTDSPYFLKAKGEFLPEEFCNPCMKDVTYYIKHVDTIRIPFPYKTRNHLAWLYTYARNTQGLRAVTWGRIDTVRKEAVFPHVVRNMLYFFVYYNGNTPVFPKESFYTTLQKDTLKVIPFQDTSVTLVPEKVFLTRKFPYKPGALRNVKDMIGAKVYGSNSPDFDKKELLFTLKEEPGIFYQDYVINKAKKSYQYYCWEAENAQTNIGELEWLTSSEYRYTNTTEPSALPIFTPFGEKAKKQDHLVRLLEKNRTKMEKVTEYDGNEETGGYSKRITLKLEYPQIVTLIRMVPRNAANGIIPGDYYELMYWRDGWKSLGKRIAEYNYVEFNGLYNNQLYWLRNLSRGQEEVPFTMRGGKQCFIYYDQKLE